MQFNSLTPCLLILIWFAVLSHGVQFSILSLEVLLIFILFLHSDPQTHQQNWNTKFNFSLVNCATPPFILLSPEIEHQCTLGHDDSTFVIFHFLDELLLFVTPFQKLLHFLSRAITARISENFTATHCLDHVFVNSSFTGSTEFERSFCEFLF